MPRDRTNVWNLRCLRMPPTHLRNIRANAKRNAPSLARDQKHVTLQSIPVTVCKKPGRSSATGADLLRRSLRPVRMAWLYGCT